MIKEHPVLLNRAPTLHRLGIQAFEPVLTEGKAIQLHPLVCAAFNADFDGDQMAVHVPLSIEAQMEARVLMMSTNNILSPANGKPIIVPSQDIVLGLYNLTRERPFAKGEYREDKKGRPARGVFASIDEVRMAYDHGEVHLQAAIKLRMDEGGWHGHELVDDHRRSRAAQGHLPAAGSVRGDQQGDGQEAARRADRPRLSRGRPEGDGAPRRCAPHDRLHVRDEAPASRSASTTWSSRRRRRPCSTRRKKEVGEIEEQYTEGLITDGERYNKVVDIWAQVAEAIAKDMMKEISTDEFKDPEVVADKKAPSFNSIFIMADSGARGSQQQMRQLAGMRGLMAKPSGEIIETPITTNFREGLVGSPVLHLDPRRS